MRKTSIILCVAALVLTSVVFISANDEDEMPPPWMEDVKVKGRSIYLIPKGARREVIGSQVVVEPPNEYVARRLYEIEQDLEKRFAEIKESHAAVEQEVEALRAEISRVKGIQTKQAIQVIELLEE